MKLNAVLDVLRSIAPEGLAEPWDKVGLHLGRPGRQVGRALLCIDLTEPVLAEAVKHRCGLIVAYHPPIFRPIDRLTESDWKQRVIAGAIRKGIAVYSPHTALDAVRGGMNDWLAAGLGKGTSTAIHPRQPGRDEYKIVVFSPVANTAGIREAMSRAGAGGIGSYRECSFEVRGEGGFRPLQGANPYLGKIGKRATVAEDRLEMLCPGRALADVLMALRAAHPYEEPAIDVVKLEPEPMPASAVGGAGRVLTLDKPVSAAVLARRVKKVLGMSRLKIAEPRDRAHLKIATVATCPGAGGSLFEEVEFCDAFVTGEMQHHHVLDLQQKGKVVILAGHTNTERPFLNNYRDAILAAGGAGVDWLISEADRAPMGIV